MNKRHLARILRCAVYCALTPILGCGGGGAALPDLTGTWQGSWSSGRNGSVGQMGLSLQQSGEQILGTGNLNSPNLAGQGPFNGQGNINGVVRDKIVRGDIGGTVGGSRVTLSFEMAIASATLQLMAGAYQISYALVSDSGSFDLRR